MLKNSRISHIKNPRKNKKMTNVWIKSFINAEINSLVFVGPIIIIIKIKDKGKKVKKSMLKNQNLINPIFKNGFPRHFVFCFELLNIFTK